MKKLIILLAGLFVYGYASAYDANVTNNSHSYPSIVTCSTITATSLFSGDNVSGIFYDNQTSGTIYLSTYPATSITATNLYPIPTGRQPIYLPVNNHYYGLAASTTNTNIDLIIVK